MSSLPGGAGYTRVRRRRWMPCVDADGLRLNYAEQGIGPALVLVKSGLRHARRAGGRPDIAVGLLDRPVVMTRSDLGSARVRAAPGGSPPRKCRLPARQRRRRDRGERADGGPATATRPVRRVRPSSVSVTAKVVRTTLCRGSMMRSPSMSARVKRPFQAGHARFGGAAIGPQSTAVSSGAAASRGKDQLHGITRRTGRGLPLLDRP
jgi:hypothetical protein